MERLNKHIAQILAVVFLVTLNYQSFHLFHHHSQDDLENHNDTNDFETNCCSSDELSIKQTAEPCVICDYEFITYDLTEMQLIFTVFSDISIIQNKLGQKRSFGYNGNNIVLRGPPCI